MTKYSYALWIENSLVDGYVTEKWDHMWEAYECSNYTTIPVYLGAYLPIHRWTKPPFIDALWFDSPASLVHELDRVLLDDSAFDYYTSPGRSKKIQDRPRINTKRPTLVSTQEDAYRHDPEVRLNLYKAFRASEKSKLLFQRYTRNFTQEVVCSACEALAGIASKEA